MVTNYILNLLTSLYSKFKLNIRITPWISNEKLIAKRGIHIFIFGYFFTFSLPYMIEKILFWSKFFEIIFLLSLHVLMSPESENHILSG